MPNKYLVKTAPLILIAAFSLSACKDDETSKTDPEIEKPVITKPETEKPGEPGDNKTEDENKPQPKPLSDIEKGEKLAAICSGCHSFKDNATRVGPSLLGVYNRDIASVQNYSYSDALKSIDGSWDEERLARFIQNPQNIAKGSRMPPVGVSSEQDAKYIVAYLKSLSP